MMRRFAFLAPLTAAMALAGAAAAQPSSVSVTVSPDFTKTAAELGQRDVQQQARFAAALILRAQPDAGVLIIGGA